MAADRLALIGNGAISHSIQQRLNAAAAQVLKRGERLSPTITLALECAGHSALIEHVLPALRQGIACGVLSIGALADDELFAEIKAAAAAGKTQCHLLSGAVGAIDLIASAKQGTLSAVRYTGRKPPMAWAGTPAEAAHDLATLTQPTLIFNHCARAAAKAYPKNANVAATIALAGLGFDATEVSLYADPTVTANIHELTVTGDFGEASVRLVGKPLPDNPKTSTLTVLSALRFIHNQTSALTI
ncbi:MAG: hypothetical protein RLZZ502_726 [Pseudomonadota bacterium]